MSRVLGVDACKGGWVGVVLDGFQTDVLFAREIAELTAAAHEGGPVGVVAVDIPIGLPDRGPRSADVLARGLVRGRASSVFTTPIRPALLEADYSTANRLSRDLTGAGISKQAHALRAKILDVDAFRSGASLTLIEVHPEVSFVHMTGVVLPRKSTWAGMVARQAALAVEGVVLTGTLGVAGETAGVDDVLDAAAAAWSARRFQSSAAVSYPAQPETFSDGWPAAIWA